MEDVADQSMGHALPAQFAEDPSSSSISQKRTVGVHSSSPSLNVTYFYAPV